MSDNFSEGWMEFEEFIDNLLSEHSLSIKDIEEYLKMYKENHE